jgi:hypothetical protein
MDTDYKAELHANGVHVECKLAPRWAGGKRIGDGTWRRCPRAGTVDRFHSHDHDGPLACGCPEYAN